MRDTAVIRRLCRERQAQSRQMFGLGTCFVPAWAMWSFSSVETAPGSMSTTRTLGL